MAGAKCYGIEALKVIVETNISQGIGVFLCGLADVAVKESLLRTVTAIESLGFKIPGRKIVINLAPADLRKNGSGYDLPIALGIIAASEQRSLPACDDYIIMGELGLNGEVRPVPGALLYAELARNQGFKGVILPEESALEAVGFRDFKVYGIRSLNDAIRILEDNEDCSDLLVWNTPSYEHMSRGLEDGSPGGDGVDFADIVGQEGAKRGLEIAAAGSHNVMMIGAPGSGKTSLAKALTGILPKMTEQESLVTSKIYSIAGNGVGSLGLMQNRPFRSPHYSASMAAIIGGGGGDTISPGEVSLAHNGVLLLDEFAQMPRSVTEALRGPIEDRKVTISRLKAKLEFPSSFMLAIASNPCPCGYWGEGDRCRCTPCQRNAYLSKLSGPILDRVDIHLWLHSVPSSMVMERGRAESSEQVAARVLKARQRQLERFAGENIFTNAEMNNKLIEKYCPLDAQCLETLQWIMDTSGMSMRAYFRIIRLARTIADLAGIDRIEPAHLIEAAGFRFLDKHDL